jgi:hypothetical protein|tara:strand:+ start:344 stop:559 length:216 start_codon:yes stop_codon:yes gene_type:complete
MKKLIKRVLSEFKNSNLSSEAAREVIAEKLLEEIRRPGQGWFLDMSPGLHEYKQQKRRALSGDSYVTKDIL